MKLSFTKAGLVLCLTLPAIVISLRASAQMRITEFMYQGLNGEFVEFTNVGTTAINMNGWIYSDNNRASAGNTVSLSAFGTVQPGESVILAETAAGTFRTAWSLVNDPTAPWPARFFYRSALLKCSRQYLWESCPKACLSYVWKTGIQQKRKDCALILPQTEKAFPLMEDGISLLISAVAVTQIRCT